MSSSTLNFGDKSVELPVKEGTIGPSVIDISKLFGQTGMFTYDPGFTSTAACESAITYIDGDEGILLYRGYPIEQLAEHGDFLETCYLLLYGELPTASQKADRAPTQATMMAIGCPSRRKPWKNRFIWSCTMVWRVTR